MTRCKLTKLAGAAIIATITLASSSALIFAQSVKIRGLIKGRSGASVFLQTLDASKVTVLLTDSTKVGQIQGVFQARRKQMSMAALIPGLAVEVEGEYNERSELVAKSVKFKGDDLKQAQSIQAGLDETRLQAQRNKAELEKQNTELKAQNEALKQQQELAAAQQEEIAANQKKIADNQAAIDAAIARFGQLDDYYILDEMTVHFGNGKTALDPKYKPLLVQFAAKAKGVRGYMIEIKGYASSVGSAALNQKLSEDRANNVAHFLMQYGHVPLTNMLAPGAMGESQQTGDDGTADGQAENRRVVIRVLQNKGVAGQPDTAL
jgi:outer membrane protein OmpA-like peptidoglycan-associated protein